MVKQSASNLFFECLVQLGLAPGLLKPQYHDPGLLDRGQAGGNRDLCLSPYGSIRGPDECFILNNEHGLISPDDLIYVLSPPVFGASGATKLIFGRFQTFSTVLSPPLSFKLSDRELCTPKEYS